MANIFKTNCRNIVRNCTLLFGVHFLFITGSVNAQQRSRSSKTVVKIKINNPVINIAFADPTVIRTASGKYYAYATQGNGQNIQVAYSNDLFHWEKEQDAMPEKPVWANNTSSFWAPHVLYDVSIKKYVLFFSSASNDTTTGKCIGVAFADLPTGPFIDKGSPLICGEGFVNIDPMALVDPATKKKLLFWGSGFKPIKVQELTNDWKNFKTGTTALDLVWPGKEADYTNLLEGAWVDCQDGKYYLYYSGDNCCGKKAHYAVMVAKADNAIGPYQRLGETNKTGSSIILAQDSTWLAPGHNSIFKDSKGNKWIAYHAIDRKNNYKKNGISRRVMLIKRIVYKNGWPVVK